MRSQTFAKIIVALSKAQSEFPLVKKESSNPFYKSKYADLPSVWSAIRDTFKKYNLCVSQSAKIENGQTVLVTTLYHDSGEWISSDYPLNPVKNDPQGLGSALTYARRYALTALIGLVSDDDDDGNAGSGVNGRQEVKSKINAYKETQKTAITETQQKELFKVLKEFGLEEKQFKSYLEVKGWNNTKDIPSDKFDEVMGWIKSTEVAF